MAGRTATADRIANNTQFQDLVAEVNRIASNTTFNGKVLLNGAFFAGVGTLQLQLGPEANSFTNLNIQIFWIYSCLTRNFVHCISHKHDHLLCRIYSSSSPIFRIDSV